MVWLQRSAPKGVHNFKRRTFDREYHEKQEELKPKGDETDVLNKGAGNSDGKIVQGPEGVRRVPGSKRAFLQERSWNPDLKKNLGKSKVRRVKTGTLSSPCLFIILLLYQLVMIQVISDPEDTQAFKSKVTGAVLRDSLAYLDHINGKRCKFNSK